MISYTDYLQVIYTKNQRFEYMDIIPKETEIILGKGTEWPLDGKITHSDSKTNIAAVLVHGSGSTDMDETIFDNKDFKDIAWGLSKHNIDTIRYDKRTFRYATKIMEIGKITVNEETIDDAIFAGRMMRDLGYKHVFLIGHSFGAMMGPTIIQESDDVFTGFISMAGSPRRLSDILISQSLSGINAIPEGTDKTQYLALLNAELQKFEKLESISSEEAKSMKIFGVNAEYYLDLNSKDVVKIAQSLQIPMLFLQGEEDFQVSLSEDYDKWKELLNSRGNVQFKSYPGLNHLFMISHGIPKRTIQEYAVKSVVSETVISDLADFMKTNS